MKPGDCVGTITLNEETMLFDAHLFQRVDSACLPREIRLAGQPRPLRYMGRATKGEEFIEDAIARACQKLASMGVADPQNAVIGSQVVPMQNLREMANVFRDIGVCSDWTGSTPLRPSNLTMQNGRYHGQPLGMLSVEEAQARALHYNRLIIITYHRLSKSYSPAVFWSAAKGYQRMMPFDTFYLTNVSPVSCCSLEDAFELAATEFKSSRTPHDIYEAGVLSVEKRDDLRHISVDVAQAAFNAPFTEDRIRRVHVAGKDVSGVLVPMKASLPIAECIRPMHITNANPFALRGARIARPSRNAL